MQIVKYQQKFFKNFSNNRHLASNFRFQELRLHVTRVTIMINDRYLNRAECFQHLPVKS
jgi:hypothetical protein